MHSTHWEQVQKFIFRSDTLYPTDLLWIPHCVPVSTSGNDKEMTTDWLHRGFLFLLPTRHTPCSETKILIWFFSAVFCCVLFCFQPLPPRPVYHSILIASSDQDHGRRTKAMRHFLLVMRWTEPQQHKQAKASCCEYSLCHYYSERDSH